MSEWSGPNRSFSRFNRKPSNIPSFPSDRALIEKLTFTFYICAFISPEFAQIEKIYWQSNIAPENLDF